MKPWERYAQPQEDGPWTKFAAAEPVAAKEESKEEGIGNPLDHGALGVMGMLVTDKGRQNLKNKVAGAVRGAGSIGSTIMYPVDKITDMVKGDREPTIAGLVTGKQPISRNEERRRSLDPALQELGAETDSLDYKVGKLGTEVAGTLGVGGTLANGVGRVLPNAPRLVSAIRTGGMTTGGPAAATRAGQVANLGIRATGGAVTGGASAGLVNPEDADLGAAVGGGLPVAAKLVGKTAQAAGKAIRGGEISPEVRNLATRANELGISIPADRIVDSKPMNALAATLDYVPFSGRAATEARMNSQLNQALSKTFGQDSSNITMALRKAEDALGGQFDDFLKTNKVAVDEQFVRDLTEAANQASNELGTDGAAIIGKQVDEIFAKAGDGLIDGQAAYNIKKTLDRIGKRNSPEAWYALDLKQKLMDALNRSVGTEKAGEFANLRKQYASMLELQKLAKNGAEGEISIARLANMKNIRNPEMQELADIAAQFVKPREGIHGAAQRAVAGMAVGGVGGLPAVAGLAAGGRLTNSALNSNFARNMVMSGPPIENSLAKYMPLMYQTAPVLSAR